MKRMCIMRMQCCYPTTITVNESINYLISVNKIKQRYYEKISNYISSIFKFRS